MAAREVEHWTFDKRVPLALVFAMFGQVVGFAWYASKLDSRIENLEARQHEARQRLEGVDRDAKDVYGRLVRLEEKQGAMLEILHRIERVLTPGQK